MDRMVKTTARKRETKNRRKSAASVQYSRVVIISGVSIEAQVGSLGRAMSGRKVVMFSSLLLVWAFFYNTALVLPGAQSFVLVPSLPRPHLSSSSALRSGGNILCSTTTALFVRNTSGEQQNPDPAFAINKKLIELGQKKRWRALLELAEKEQASFNNVNYATLMSQLGRIRSFNKQDPRFLAILQVLTRFV